VKRLQPTVDALQPTADGGVLAGASDVADAVVNANFVYAELVEPVAGQVTADSTGYTADNVTWPTAVGGILEGARDLVGADVIPAIAVGGGYYLPRRRLRVIGYGYGVLPPLQGEGHGVVGVVGTSNGTLQLTGAARGAVDDDFEVLLMMLLAA